VGTSGSYGGPGGTNPLVPSWLPTAAAPPSDTPSDIASVPPTSLDSPPPHSVDPSEGSQDIPPAPSPLPQPTSRPDPTRFTAARTNLSKYSRSGGRDRTALGRAISSYVSSASGGPKQATRRMGSSLATSRGILSFLADVRQRGSEAALRTLSLERLAGRPIQEIFLGLADYVCPDGGTVDEGIARDAFIETIAELPTLGVVNLDELTADQVRTVFELYAAHSIEARLYNDIGMKLLVLPSDTRAFVAVEAQLFDFIRRGVSDAMAKASDATLTHANVSAFVSSVYESSFRVLQIVAELMSHE
jgi:hypothetical protein